jgi:hypothetical protein
MAQAPFSDMSDKVRHSKNTCLGRIDLPGRSLPFRIGAHFFDCTSASSLSRGFFVPLV